MKPYDFLVIGGGSAGFNAARTAASLGKRVAIVDGAQELGGLCILKGCMPSKTLLYSTEVLHLAQKAKTFGLKIPSAAVDMKALHARKKKIIGEFAGYRAQALDSGKYDIHRSHARFLDPHTLALADGRTLSAGKILVSTGSQVSVPAVPGLAGTPFWTSDDILDLDFVPPSVIVLGGGIVACELAQFLRRIGSKVTLIQRSKNILKDHSPAASEVVQQSFRDEGIDLHTDTAIEKISGDARGVTVKFTSAGKPVTRRAAFLFNALGREPNTTGLDLAAAGVKTTPAGRIAVNRWQQTSAAHIYAGGDVCGPHDIVHLAVAQGELAARHAFGVKGLKPLDPALLLNVVFTDPPLATIGLQENELAARGEKFLVATYPFNDHGKSILMDANYGYVKIIAEPSRGRILGAEIVGRDAGELIHIFSGPLAMKATVFDLLRAPWYHPTLAEILTYPLEELAGLVKTLNVPSLLRRLLSLPVIARLPVRVRGGLAEGAQWTLFPWTAYWRGTHEPAVQARILALNADWTGRHIWDLGSHYGLYAVGLGRRVGPAGSVAAFEPNPLSYQRLCLHVRRNRLPWVKTFPCAVSDTDAQQRFFIYKSMENTTTHLAYEGETWDENTPTIQVKSRRLDDLVETGEINAPDFIKLDVEGHGHKALAGAARTLARRRPVLLIGMHSDPEITGILALLTPLRYRVTPVLENSPPSPTAGHDYLFEPLP